MSIEFLHSMVRVTDIDASLKFYCDGLGLEQVRRVDHEQGRFTLVFLASPADVKRCGGRNFGHLAYMVDDIYAAVERLAAQGVTISRPPRDGYMAFVRSPDGISVELLQKGERKAPKEPWASAENVGAW